MNRKLEKSNRKWTENELEKWKSKNEPEKWAVEMSWRKSYLWVSVYGRAMGWELWELRRLRTAKADGCDKGWGPWEIVKPRLLNQCNSKDHPTGICDIKEQRARLSFFNPQIEPDDNPQETKKT